MCWSCRVLSWVTLIPSGYVYGIENHVRCVRGDLLGLQGVMLSHSNMFYQLANFDHFIAPQPGDTTLSLLPPWHIYGKLLRSNQFGHPCSSRLISPSINRSVRQWDSRQHWLTNHPTKLRFQDPWPYTSLLASDLNLSSKTCQRRRNELYAWDEDLIAYGL